MKEKKHQIQKKTLPMKIKQIRAKKWNISLIPAY